jgi:hypothetical protein
VGLGIERPISVDDPPLIADIGLLEILDRPDSTG